MAGVRGFSETNLKYMRIFYEEWNPYVNRQPVADDFAIIDETFLLTEIRQPMADELNWNEFISIGFTHHMEILLKTDTYEERIFYIHECATRAWDKYTLRDYIKSGLYQNKESLPNNFDTALTDRQFVINATKAFKENYYLDFINTENLGEADEDIDERIIENQIVKNIKDFIIRFGTDFIFMGNQYRLEVAGKFKHTYLGQLNTYLTVLDDKVKKPHENPSVGLILCKDMNKTFVDYVIRGYDKPLGVATYMTSKDMPEEMKKALPPVEDLKKLLSDTNTAE